MAIIRTSSLLLLTACTSPPSPSTENIHSKFFTYTVANTGENLSIISEWYCNDAQAWRRFFISADRAQKTLHKGDVILIPNELVKKEEAIPSSFIKSRQPTKTEPPKVAVESGSERAPADAQNDSSNSDAKATAQQADDNKDAVQNDFLNAFTSSSAKSQE